MSGLDPSRGVDYLADVFVALLQDCPSDWSESRRWANAITHRPTGAELVFTDWLVRLKQPQFFVFGFRSSVRLYWAKRHAMREIARLKRQENANRLATRLAAMRGVLGPHRDSDGSGEAGETAQTGSTVGDSAGRKASPKDQDHDQ